MAYEKQIFVDRVVDDSGKVVVEGTTLTAQHLSHIEDGIVAAQQAAQQAAEAGATAEQAKQIAANTAAIEELKQSAGGGPIGYVESLDENNLVNLRDLESGSYVLYGYFKPYAGAPNTLTIDTQLINVVRKSAGSHILIFSTLNSVVNFLEIMVDDTAEKGFTYSRTDINLLEMNALLKSLSSAVRVAEVTLLAANWAGDASPYSQVVTIEGITPYSQVDLTPSVEQLTIFHDKDLAFVTENEGGVVTVYAIGDKPLNDYIMQVTIREVTVYE